MSEVLDNVFNNVAQHTMLFGHDGESTMKPFANAVNDLSDPNMSSTYGISNGMA